MAIRVAGAFISRDAQGYFVEYRGSVSFRGGKKACKRACGKLNREAAKRKEQTKVAIAERTLWRLANQQAIRDFNGFRRAQPQAGGKLIVGRYTIRRNILTEAKVAEFLAALKTP